MACDGPHGEEIVSVDRLPDAAAPPEWGSEPHRAAVAACSTAASTFVGGDWHLGALGIQVHLPARTEWDAGVRDAPCGVFAVDDLWADPAARTAPPTLRGALTAGSALGRAGERDVQRNEYFDEQGFLRIPDAMPIVACTEPHNAEFAGLAHPIADTFDQLDQDQAEVDGRPVVASFLGRRPGDDRRADVRERNDELSRQRWDAGDRLLRCYAIVPSKTKVHASIRNLGRARLPA